MNHPDTHLRGSQRFDARNRHGRAEEEEYEGAIRLTHDGDPQEGLELAPG